MKKLLIIVAILVALAGFGIYKLVGTVSKAAERGEAAVAAFHKEYNAKGAATIYKGAAPAFHTAVSEEQFNGLITMLHEKLGEWKSGERAGINVNTNNGHETLTLKYDSVFALGKATEEFVFDYNGDQPLLLGYNVEPPQLAGQSVGNPAPAPVETTPSPTPQ